MKKLFIIVIIIASTKLAFAQKTLISTDLKLGPWTLSEVGITSGKGALTSGLDTRIEFMSWNDSTKVFFLQANNDRIVGNFGKKIGKLKILQSVGVFKNIPWTGPWLIYSNDVLDFSIWNGIGFAKTVELKAPGFSPKFFFSYEGVGLTFIKNNRIGISAMWFATEKGNWFLSYKRNINIGKYSKLFAECTYNRALDIPMFMIGYSLKLKR